MDGGAITYAVLSTVLAAAAIVLFLLALRPVSARQLAGFAGRYGVRVTPITSAMLRPQLRIARALRLVGASLGFAAVVLLRAATHDDWATGPTLLWVVAGYLFGAVLGSLRSFPTERGKVRAAQLTPRRAVDYLPRRALVWLVVTSGAAVAAGIAEHLVRRRPMASGPDRVVPEILLCLAAAAITLAAIGAVVRRAQAADNAELVTADDALRAHSLHVVAGTGLAVVAACSAGTLFQLGLDSAARPLRWTCPWLGLAELVLAFTAWFGLRTAPWWVGKSPTS